MSDLIVLAASAAVVVFMVVVAALLGFRQSARIDDAELVRLASAEHTRIDAATIDARGASAVARLSDGKLLIAKVMADGVSARIAQAKDVALRLGNGRVKVRFGDVGFPAVDLRLSGEAPDWLKQMATRG
jgi:hypothetical protein